MSRQFYLTILYQMFMLNKTCVTQHPVASNGRFPDNTGTGLMFSKSTYCGWTEPLVDADFKQKPTFQ